MFSVQFKRRAFTSSQTRRFMPRFSKRINAFSNTNLIASLPTTTIFTRDCLSLQAYETNLCNDRAEILNQADVLRLLDYKEEQTLGECMKEVYSRILIFNHKNHIFTHLFLCIDCKEGCMRRKKECLPTI